MSTRQKTHWFPLVLALALLASLLAVPAMVSAGRPIGHSFVISNNASLTEVNPAIAYNSRQQEYLVVWWNDRATIDDDIYAERVAKDGKLLGGVWVTPQSTDHQYPSVAYNSARNEYLVVWGQYNMAVGEDDIYGQRLSVPIGPGSPQKQGSPILIAPNTGLGGSRWRPAVAYSGNSDKYLVVFMEGSAPYPYRVQGRVVLSDGTPTGSSFDIAPTTWSQEYPAIAYNRRQDNYLVVWQQMVGGDYDIYARLVRTNGTLIGADSFGVYVLGGWQDTHPSVAAIRTATSLGEYLVVWESDNPSNTNAAVRSQLVTGDGNLTGFTPYNVVWYPEGNYAISTVAGNEDSQHFLIVEKCQLNSPFVAHEASSDLTQWTLPTLLDSGNGADHPAVASGPTGDFLVAFDRAPFGTRDIYGQVWGNRLYLPLVLKNH